MGITQRCISISLISFLLLQSCGFKQDMKTHQYGDNSIIRNRVQTNVGLVVPRPMFRKEVYTRGTHIKLYPGFYETLKGKYERLFKSIRIVGEDEIDYSYDVLIEANCDILNDDELFFTAYIFNTNNRGVKLMKSEPIATTSGPRAAAYFALTFTIIGAPLAFNHSNSHNERDVHKALLTDQEYRQQSLYVRCSVSP